jgi:phosphoribosylglycinamide formyltransferase-1
LVSGGGTNLQALINAQSRGNLSPGIIKLVISSRHDARAQERAKAAGIETLVIAPRDDQAMLKALAARDIGVIALAGYLSMLSPAVIKQYERKILNVHPSLLPAFGGKGFYGLRVHEAALERGVKISGATVHFVDGIYDNGEIILQKAVDVLPGDTPESLQQRVMREAEWVIFPKAVGMVCRGEV